MPTLVSEIKSWISTKTYRKGIVNQYLSFMQNSLTEKVVNLSYRGSFSFEPEGVFMIAQSNKEPVELSLALKDNDNNIVSLNVYYFAFFGSNVKEVAILNPSTEDVELYVVY